MDKKSKLFLYTAVLSFFCCIRLFADWVVFEETSVVGKISGSIKKGYIIRTASGNVFEVTDYVYLYEYEYSPSVLVLRDGDRFKLLIEGIEEPLVCRCLNCETDSASKDKSNSSSAEIIESFIVSKFDGLDYGNIYKLANGQIWEQVDAWIWLWIWVNPKVMIWPEGAYYKMKVEGIDHAIIVERLK